MKNFDRARIGADLELKEFNTEQEQGYQIKKVAIFLKSYINKISKPDKKTLDSLGYFYSKSKVSIEKRYGSGDDPIKKQIDILHKYKDQNTRESLQEIDDLLKEIAASRLNGIVLEAPSSLVRKYDVSEFVEILKQLDNPKDFITNNKEDVDNFFYRSSKEMDFLAKDGNEHIFASYIELLKYAKYFSNNKDSLKRDLGNVIWRWGSCGAIEEAGEIIKNSDFTLDDFQQEISSLFGVTVFYGQGVITEKNLSDFFDIPIEKVEEILVYYVLNSHISSDAFMIFLKNVIKNELSPSLSEKLDKIFSQRINDDQISIFSNQVENYKSIIENEVFQKSLPLTLGIISDKISKNEFLEEWIGSGEISPNTPSFVAAFTATDNLPLVSSLKKALINKDASEVIFYGEEGKNDDSTKETVELSHESKEFLERIRESIKKAHQDYLYIVRDSDDIPEDEKRCLLGEKVGGASMNNMLKNIEGLTARLIVETTRDTRDLENSLFEVSISLDKTLQDAIRAFENVYSVDIPLYDKLYTEFDAVRNSGRKPMEVYLGRDGVYAYIGRRAQEAARLGAAKDDHEILEIHPKYLVYPSFFRDDMSYDAKKTLLEQERISPDSDPLFYDTGYVGSIPEQIMQIMNFDEEEIDERISLLSSTKTSRILRGLREDEDSTDAVFVIENHSKDVESATGMYRDHKGKIRPIEVPTSPAERMRFAFIKQAIARHYWFTEKKRGFKPHREVDTKKHKMFLDPEVTRELPVDFLKRPEFYLKDIDAKEITPLFPKRGDLFVVEMPGFSTKEAREQFVNATVKRDQIQITHLQEDYSIKGYKVVGLVLDKNEGNEIPKHFLLFQAEESVAENKALQKAA